MPPVPESRRREAVILGDERFMVLAEQVDRRVRQGRPLMQETVDRLTATEHQESEPPTGDGPMHNSKPVPEDSRAASEGVDHRQAPPASAKTGRGNPGFAHHSKAAAGPTKPSLSGGRSQRAAPNSDPEASMGKLEASCEKPLSKWRLILSVFLPFAAGYYLSFFFRTINASISPALASDFGLGAAETGLLASVYFLVFAGAQIPIGMLLDRYGPRRVQSVLLVIAVGGATLFGNADGFADLLWRDTNTGTVAIWFMRFETVSSNGAPRIATSTPSSSAGSSTSGSFENVAMPP
jgi:hypothetical protein